MLFPRSGRFLRRPAAVWIQAVAQSASLKCQNPGRRAESIKAIFENRGIQVVGRRDVTLKRTYSVPSRGLYRKIPFLCGFLRHLCRAWEKDARRANAPFSFYFNTI